MNASSADAKLNLGKCNLALETQCERSRKIGVPHPSCDPAVQVMAVEMQQRGL